jgi:hypothetical protein
MSDIIVLDTETTGFNSKLDKIVQFTYLVCSNSFVQRKLYNNIIKVNIRIQNSNIHGITNEISTFKGVNIRDALLEFCNDLKNVSTIISHNCKFDINFIEDELINNGMKHMIPLLRGKQIICSMKTLAGYVGIQNKRNGNIVEGFKMPKQCELYQKVFNKPMKDAHNSKSDVTNLFDILSELFKRNIFVPSRVPIYSSDNDAAPRCITNMGDIGAIMNNAIMNNANTKVDDEKLMEEIENIENNVLSDKDDALSSDKDDEKLGEEIDKIINSEAKINDSEVKIDSTNSIISDNVHTISELTENPRPVSVTKLLERQSNMIISKCFGILHTKTIKEASCNINIPVISAQDKTIENVSDINGIALPILFEYKLTNKIFILDMLIEILETNSTDELEILEQSKIKKDDKLLNDINIERNKIEELKNQQNNINILREKIKEKVFNLSDALLLSNIYTAFMSGYIYRIKQITKYDWISKEDYEQCLHNLESLNISTKAAYEDFSEVSNKEFLLDFTLCGRCDCVDGNTLYEFKAVKSLKQEYYIQAAIYMHLLKKKYPIEKCYLYNILQDELIEININTNEFNKICNILIRGKYEKINYDEDELFLKDINAVKNKYGL